MRRTLYAIAALIVITVTGCNKNDDIVDDAPAKGALRFKNMSADLYDIYVDDVKYGDLYGGDSATYPVSAVSHRVKAIQTGNITGTATLRQQVIIVPKDSLAIFLFP